MDIKKWYDYEFVNSSGLTEEYAQFAKDFKKHIKKILPPNSELASFNRGHFYLSGFIRRDNDYVYFSSRDVRWDKDWHTNLLVRTAKNDKDYTGGSNHFASLDNFTYKVERLLDQPF